MPATQSLRRMAARPWATASYNVAAETSTLCDTPSRSWIVTRHERTFMRGKVSYSLFIRHDRLLLFFMVKQRTTNRAPQIQTRLGKTNMESRAQGAIATIRSRWRDPTTPYVVTHSQNVGRVLAMGWSVARGPVRFWDGHSRK